MAAARALGAFGLGIIGAGFYWMIYNDIINNFILKYIVSRNSEYFRLDDFLWNGLPILVFFLGIFVLIFAGMSYNRGSVRME